MMNIELPFLLIVLVTIRFANGLEVICPVEWSQWKGGCYRFYNEPELSWDEAKNHCEQIELSPEICPGKTAQLVTIASKGENEFVFQLWKSLRPNPAGQTLRVWIGLNDKVKEGEYVWTDGSPVVYKNWTPGLPDQWSPNQDCGEMWIPNVHPDVGYWNDFVCSSKHAFMCEFRCC